jgi:hypothetical protein
MCDDVSTAKIADLLQSGACKSKAALVRKLEVGAFKLRPALQRVLDTENAKTVKEYITLVANKKQKRR